MLLIGINMDIDISKGEEERGIERGTVDNGGTRRRRTRTNMSMGVRRREIHMRGIHSTSSLFLNNIPLSSPLSLSSYCSYIPQSDVLLPNLTPREHLMFSALLRERNVKERGGKDSVEQRVNSVLRELYLEKVADQRVGSPAAGGSNEDGGGIGGGGGENILIKLCKYLNISLPSSFTSSNRGLSGGEQRRCSIGMELVSNRPLLLCDEPSSPLSLSPSPQCPLLWIRYSSVPPEIM